MPGVLDLVGPAEGLLAETVRWFTDVAGIDLPERRYVAPGHPQIIAWDCEQLVVACAGTALGIIEGDTALTTTQPGGQASLMMRHAIYSIALVRCVPLPDEQGNPPPAAALHGAGVAALRDCGALSQMCSDIATYPTTHGRGTWLPLGSQIRAGAVTQIGPLGDMVGYQVDVAFTVGKVV